MIFLIVFHGSLHLFIFKLFIDGHCKEIHQMIEEGEVENNLSLFVFHKNEFGNNSQHIEWIKENEFRINGEMYDVVRKEIFEDSVYVYCFQDEKESVLYANMERILKRLNEDEPNTINSIVSINKLISKLFSNSINELDYSCLNERGIEFPDEIFKILKGVNYLNTPPPQS